MEESKTQTSGSRFQFVQKDTRILDVQMETKKIGFFQDAMMRFSENKGSLIAGVIIFILMMFSIVTPYFTGFTATQTDDYYTNVLPKVSPNADGFWDGTQDETIGEAKYVLFTQYGRVKKVYRSYVVYDEDLGTSETKYDVHSDTYRVGCKYDTFTQKQLDDVLTYDAKVSSDLKILQPLVDQSSWAEAEGQDPYQIERIFEHDANYCYKLKVKGTKPIYDSDGKLQYVFRKDVNGNYVYYLATGVSGNVYDVRINYDNYYVYNHGHRAAFVLGSDTAGRDIMTRLAVGGRISLILGFSVSFCNLIIGLIYGSIEGYYGGTADLIMERISEILSEVPFVIVITLFQAYNSASMHVSTLGALFIAYVATGWLGTASTTRMQFYRYKNQEYVLAARTLGASDGRLIFRHILPNSVGTLVTSSVLMIPGVIFGESSLTYLGIINFEASNTTSIGTMLSEGQKVYTLYPNVILWPALFISLLMICFNVFGNGLRDAFNPQLRGAGNE